MLHAQTYAERAIVTRFDPDGGVYFTVPRLTGPSFEHGPHRMIYPSGMVDAPLLAETDDTSTESGGSGDPAFAPHNHDVFLRPLQVGDLIIVMAVGGEEDGWVVIGRQT